MYRNVLHTEYSRTRHLKKSSPARNQKLAISEYSVVLFTYIFQKKREQIYILQEGKVTFVGYSESLKAYRIYFPGFKRIEINRDVTFDEDSAYIKSRKKPAEEPEEAEAPKIHDTIMNEETQEEDQEFEEPQRPVDPPQEKNPHKRKPA